MKNIAIIGTNYNYQYYVCDCIQSVLDQDYPMEHLTMCMVDDGSDDQSHAFIVNKFGLHETETIQLDEPWYKGPVEIRKNGNLILLRCENSGPSVARNLGIYFMAEWADIYGIIDGDDQYTPTKVSRCVAKLEEDPAIGVVWTDYLIHRTIEDGQDYTKYEYKYAYDAKLLQRMCIVHSAGFIKKEYLLQIVNPQNGEIYDSNLHAPGSQTFAGCTEDYDLWLRLSKVCMMYHIAEPLSIVAEHGDNASLKMTNEIFQQHAAYMGAKLSEQNNN